MRALLALLVALAAVCSPVNVEVEKVRRWVARQGLRDYRDRVVSLGVETMFDLPLLQQEDLESTGMSKLQVRKFIKEASNLPKRKYMSQDAFEWLQELGFADHEHELTDLGVVSVEDMEGLTKEVLLQTSLKSKQIDSLLAGVRGMEDTMSPELEDWLLGLGLRSFIGEIEERGILTMDHAAALTAAKVKALPLSKVQRRKLVSAAAELQRERDESARATSAVDSSVKAWLDEIGLGGNEALVSGLPQIGAVTLHDMIHVRMPDLDEIRGGGADGTGPGVKKIDKRKLLREANILKDKLRRQREKQKKKRKEQEAEWRRMGDGIGTAANKFQDGDLLGAFRDVARVVASAKPGTTVHKIKTSVVSGAMKGAMMVQNGMKNFMNGTAQKWTMQIAESMGGKAKGEGDFNMGRPVKTWNYEGGRSHAPKEDVVSYFNSLPSQKTKPASEQLKSDVDDNPPPATFAHGIEDPIAKETAGLSQQAREEQRKWQMEIEAMENNPQGVTGLDTSALDTSTSTMDGFREDLDKDISMEAFPDGSSTNADAAEAAAANGAAAPAPAPAGGSSSPEGGSDGQSQAVEEVPLEDA